MQTVKWPKLTWKKATVALIPSIGNETSALVCCGCWNAHFPALDKSLCGRNHKNIWFWISEFQIQLSPLFFPDMGRHYHWASQLLYSKNLNWIFRFFCHIVYGLIDTLRSRKVWNLMPPYVYKRQATLTICFPCLAFSFLSIRKRPSEIKPRQDTTFSFCWPTLRMKFFSVSQFLLY